jgi:malate/lactate dehydrogenase
MATVKVTLVGGAGGVGASTAFNLLVGSAFEVAIVDTRASQVQSHVMDLAEVLEQSPGGSVHAGGDSDVRDADVVVICAAVPLTLNTSRLAYLAENARIMDELGDLLSPESVVVVVANPVDPLVLRLQERTGLPRTRVLGYTLNDSLRFRTGLGRALGTRPGAVEAWVIGEHGDSGVPLLDRVRVDGALVRPTPEQAESARTYLREWYVRHVALDSGRSSTWTSGLGVARMVTAIAADTGTVWPASIVLDGEYGISGTAVGVPVVLGRGGALAVQEWRLSDEDLAALRESAEVVRAAAASIESPLTSRS